MIVTNGVSWNDRCSKTKKKLIEHLKSNGYYWSKSVCRYIDDKNVKIEGGSGTDYQIEKLTEI